EKCFLALYKQVARDFKILFSGRVDPLLADVRKWASQEPCLRFKYEDEFVTGKLLDVLEDGSGLFELENGKQNLFRPGNISHVEFVGVQEPVIEHYSRA
ncbi:hypothetical protein, partial [Candidatus Similichlamydia epinepheli]|uniref:hypothetical protein n=1 Tax=Candidatus Similichlamydia epinepheli TaxID=1903953 RepID=UPI0013008262